MIRVMRALKRDKAGGLDRIPPGLVKDLSACPMFVTSFTMLINVCIQYSFFPTSWNELLLCPVLKKGKDPFSPSSYRPIHVASVLAKVVAMHPWTSATAKWVSRKTMVLGMPYSPSSLHVVRRYKRNGLHAVFVDFRGAFDSVDRA